MTPGRQGYLILILLLVSVATWWANRFSEPEPPPQPGDAHRPDYQVDGLTVTAMGPDGTPGRHLTTDQMRHYPDDDTTELDRPHLVVYAKDGPPWNIRSEQGWVGPDGERMLLEGQVRVDREGGPGSEPVHLATDRLRVQPKAEYAETDQPVRITSAANWIEAVGLQAWFGEPVRIKLLSNVRGRYEVQ